MSIPARKHSNCVLVRSDVVAPPSVLTNALDEQVGVRPLRGIDRPEDAVPEAYDSARDHVVCGYAL